MNRKLTDKELQQAFDLAYILHPVFKVALSVIIDAFAVFECLEKRQARRRRSKKHYKTLIPPERLLQFAVFLASYVRELDQESPRPRLEPKYKPTRDDLLVRYIKHLIWKTSLLPCRELAIGIGCLLYDYKPKEVAELFSGHCEGDLRHIKMRIRKEMAKRFSHLVGVLPADEKPKLRTVPANDRDRKLVQQLLSALIPWQSSHIKLSPGALIIETVFNTDPGVSDWDRKHALIDPECAGFERLVTEHNEYFGPYSASKTIFAEPSLLVPDFQGTPTPPLFRFNRRLLSESEKMLLKEVHKPSGPWAYDWNVLRGYLVGSSLTGDMFDELEICQTDDDLDIDSDKLHFTVDFGSSAGKCWWTEPEVKQPPSQPISAGMNVLVIGMGGTGYRLSETILTSLQGYDATAASDGDAALERQEGNEYGTSQTADGGYAGVGRAGCADDLALVDVHPMMSARDWGDSPEKLSQEFETLVMPHLEALCQLLCRDLIDPNEVKGELYLRAYRSFRQCEAGANVRPWLYKLVSQMIRVKRREMRDYEFTLADAETISQILEFKRFLTLLDPGYGWINILDGKPRALKHKFKPRALGKLARRNRSRFGIISLDSLQRRMREGRLRKVKPGSPHRKFDLEQWGPFPEMVAAPGGWIRIIEISEPRVKLNQATRFKPTLEITSWRGTPANWHECVRPRPILDSLLMSKQERDETRRQDGCRIDPLIRTIPLYESVRPRSGLTAPNEGNGWATFLN